MGKICGEIVNNDQRSPSSAQAGGREVFKTTQLTTINYCHKDKDKDKDIENDLVVPRPEGGRSSKQPNLRPSIIVRAMTQPFHYQQSSPSQVHNHCHYCLKYMNLFLLRYLDSPLDWWASVRTVVFIAFISN